jgi:dUTP pyrophosphatase
LFFTKKIKIQYLKNYNYPEWGPVKYSHPGDSGFDLRAAIDKDIICYPGCVELIPTGISVEIPKGYEIQVRPRSGLAIEGITIVNSPGTIDSGYRGELIVILIELDNNKKVIINPGHRIAQAIVVKLPKIKLIESKELKKSYRGKSGLGSSGFS